MTSAVLSLPVGTGGTTNFKCVIPHFYSHWITWCEIGGQY